MLFRSSTSVQALRSPILRDAEDGSISALGIMRGLPTDFRLFQGPQVVAEEPTCKPDSARCTSLLSWYLGLPGRIQTRQRPDPFLDR